MIDQLTGRKRECLPFSRCIYFSILLWFLFPNDYLQWSSLKIKAKFDEFDIFRSFRGFFLLLLGWLCSYGIFVIHTYYIFCNTQCFSRYGLIGSFFMQYWEVNAASVKQTEKLFFSETDSCFRWIWELILRFFSHTIWQNKKTKNCKAYLLVQSN